MKSSIYISSEKIAVIGYKGSGRKVSVKSYHSISLPEGTMINGKITDSVSLTEALSSFRRKYPALFKSPSLIVDGSFITSKKINVPKLNDIQYYRLITDEFTDTVAESEVLVCGYHKIKHSEQLALLACATEKTQIESYMSVFRDAKIKLESIKVGIEAVLSYVETHKRYQNSTFVINVLEGVTMISMIFNNGVNVFVSRTRLYSEQRELLLSEALQNLSGLIQFNKSEKFNDIEYSYYLGIDENDLAFMQGINTHADIKIDTFDVFSKTKGSSKLSYDCGFVFLNTFLEKDSIDFISSYKMLAKLEKLKRPKKHWILVLVLLVLALSAGTAYIITQTAQLKEKVDELEQYLSEEEIVRKANEISETIAMTSYYSGIVGQFKALEDEIGRRTALSTYLLDLISKTNADKVKVSSIDYNSSDSTLQVSAISETERDSAQYVEALKKNELITAVSYSGYSSGGEGSSYSFSIKIQLAILEAASESSEETAEVSDNE